MTAFRSLVLNGSPRPDGNSMVLARAVADAMGGEADEEALYRRKITPCRACGACERALPCPLADDMPALLLRLASADVLIVASPLHFTSLSAPVIAFYSRLQPFWRSAERMRETFSFRPREGVLAVTAGSHYPEMFRPARSVTAAVFNTLRIRFAGMATAADTDRVPAAANAEATAVARSLGKAIGERLESVVRQCK